MAGSPGKLFLILAIQIMWLLSSANAQFLLHRWSFNGDLSDSAGGAHASLNPSALIIDNALSGSADLPLQQSLADISDQITIEIWYTLQNLDPFSRLFVLSSAALSGANWEGFDMISHNGSHGQCIFSQASTGIVTSGVTGGISAIGQEYHFVFTYEKNSGSKAFLNGLLISENPAIVNNVNINDISYTVCRLGDNPTFSAPVNALIDEFRIYNIAFELGDVVRNYQNGPDGATSIASAPQTCREVIAGSSSHQYDFSQDCYVRNCDYAMMAEHWLDASPLHYENLLHRWSFNENGNDSAGGATAQLNGSAAFTSTELDVSGGASGGGAWAELPVASTMNSLTTEITVEGWLTPTANPATYGFYRAWLLGDGTLGAYLGGLQLIPTNGAGLMVAPFEFTDGTGIIAEPHGLASPAISQNTPFHFAVTYKQNVISELYYNGALLASNLYRNKPVNGITYTNDACRIGSHPFGPFGIPHLMDEFRIYDVALSTADIAANYAAGPDGAIAGAGSLGCFANTYDFNGDCVVDIDDLGMFINSWLDCANPEDPNCEQQDWGSLDPSTTHSRWNKPVAPVAGAKNIVPNSSFECGSYNWSSLGKRTGWGGGLSSLHGQVVDINAYEGNHCLQIDLGPGITPITHFNAWPAAREIQATPLAANVGWLQMDKGYTYTFSAYMRADRPNVEARLLFMIGDTPSANPAEVIKNVTLSEQWQRYTYTVLCTEPDMFVAVGPNLSLTPEAAATVWVDAVQVEKGVDASEYCRRENIEIGFASEHFGNVFDISDPIQLNLYGSNTNTQPAVVTVQARLENYFGSTLTTSMADIHIPAQSTTTGFLPLSTSGRGFYKATLTWESEGVQHTENFRMAVIDKYDRNDSLFGMNLSPATDELRQSMREGGVIWARNTSFDWQQMEPVQGQVSFQSTDEQVNSQIADGLNVLGVLPVWASSEWASEDPGSGGWYAYAAAPSNPSLLNNIIDLAVDHHKDRVRHWEFINEPVWIPHPTGNLTATRGYTVADYISLLQGAYSTMKAADPTCKVIGGLGIQAELPLGDQFISAGGLNYVDYYNLHPYQGSNPPEFFISHMQRILSAMDSNGGRKPIWATEQSYFTLEDPSWTPMYTTGDISGHLADEKQVADWQTRFAAIMFAHNVEKLFFHYADTGEVNNSYWIQANAFWQWQYGPTKVYTALAAMANMLGPSPVYVAPLSKPASIDSNSTGGVYGYAFDCNGTGVLIAWKVESQSNLSWALQKPIGVDSFDIMGNAISGNPVNLDISIVYLTSTSMTASQLAQNSTLVLQ